MIKNFDLTNWICFSSRISSKSCVSNDKKWMVKFRAEIAKANIDNLEKIKELTEKTIEI